MTWLIICGIVLTVSVLYIAYEIGRMHGEKTSKAIFKAFAEYMGGLQHRINPAREEMYVTGKLITNVFEEGVIPDDMFSRMCDYIDKNGKISMADIFEIVGQPAEPIDHDYGYLTPSDVIDNIMINKEDSRIQCQKWVNLREESK